MGRLSLTLIVVLALMILASAGAYLYYAAGRNDSTGQAVVSQGGVEAGRFAGVMAVNDQPANTTETDVNTPATDSTTSQPISQENPDESPAAKTNPKVQSSIVELAVLQKTKGLDEAVRFAETRNIEIRDGKVTVVLETASNAEASPGNSSNNTASGNAADASAPATSAITATGGDIQSSHGNLIQASIPVEAITALARDATITYIREPARPAPFAIKGEGIADIGATAWQAAGNTGVGVKMAVLDPGFAGYQQAISSGDLPAGVITKSFRADGDITGGGEKHGTACAEIIHEVAPGAQLYLVNFSTDVELGNAVDYLAAQGITVVSASWGFFGSFRGDGQGPVDDLVHEASNSGIFWANAAGNAAQSHWSGRFTDTDSDSWNEFAGADEKNTVSAQSGEELDIYLSWNGWPVTDQDYDMYLVWEGEPNTTVAASNTWQSGTQAPVEEIHYTVPQGRSGNYWIVINKYDYNATGDAVFQLYTYPKTIQYKVAAGSLGGQPTDSAYAMTVGAVPVGSSTIEAFSSRGPTLDGRIKPDIAAPDRILTATYSPTSFWGTSAAAPHVAGAGALVKAVYPSFTPAQVQGFLESRATDLGAAGKDSVFGSGRLNLGAAPCNAPQLDIGTPAPSWVTYANYRDRLLTVTYSLCEYDGAGAYEIQVEGSVNSGSVTTSSALPMPLGDIPGGTSKCLSLTMQYYVPQGVNSFRSTTYVTLKDACGTSYALPVAFPGA